MNWRGLLVSVRNAAEAAEALDGARLPPGLVRRDLGPVALRGKAEPVALAVIGHGN